MTNELMEVRAQYKYYWELKLGERFTFNIYGSQRSELKKIDASHAKITCGINRGDIYDFCGNDLVRVIKQI